MGYRVAVVGATGNVGREMLATLAERKFPADEVIALASARSVGREVSFGDNKTLKVKNLADFDFTGHRHRACPRPGAKVSAEFAPRAAAKGCVVIDNTSHFRMDPDVPLVVPEVNPDAIAKYAKRNIIANPNCSTIQMVVALKPLHDAATIKRIVVATYQSVSGAGKEAMDELFNQTRAIFVNDPLERERFTKQIAFNVIPAYRRLHGGRRDQGRMEDGGRDAQDPRPRHPGARHLRARAGLHRPRRGGERRVRKADLGRRCAREALRDAPGVAVVDHRADEGYVTPVECAGEDDVYVSRIRRDATVKHGLSLWVVADNLRKGAALNAVQIAEELIAHHLKAKARV